MTDVMVSIRLPKKLLEELQNTARKNHYMDLSEAVRSILRQKWEENADPLSYEVGKLRQIIKEELKRNIAEKSEQRLVEELRKIRENIRDEMQK